MRRMRYLAIFASIITISILSASVTVVMDAEKIFNEGVVIQSATTIINGDSQLASFPGITGSGLAEDPYIIEDTVFDAAGSGTALWILSTTRFVTIRNCTFKNSGTGSNAGLRIDQCINVTVTNCSIYNNRYGIYLSVSKDIAIIGNNISTNTNIGIFLESSNKSIISGNLIHQNGILGVSVAFYSGANEISANSFEANGAHFSWDATGPGNSWNAGILGNYWDDYKTRYPLATNNTLNYNTPYEISSVLNQRDEYPLVSFTGIHNPIV
nr:right-handed parallel beta-helix repeat-containing protein [Candidatus Sigynarchaeum springense]